MREKKENKKGKEHYEGEGLGARTRETHLALLNILEDIEEARHLAVEEKDKTLAIIANLTDGLLFFDKENRLSLINPVAEDLLDIKAIEAIGKSFLRPTPFLRFETIAKFLRKTSKKIFRKEIQIR